MVKSDIGGNVDKLCKNVEKMGGASTVEAHIRQEVCGIIFMWNSWRLSI